MKALFRVDASLDIGSGHVMRCLTLAKAFVEKGGHVEFICREHPGNLIDKINSEGFLVHVLKTDESNSEIDQKSDLLHSKWLGVTQQKEIEECKSRIIGAKADWVFVDHYAIDHTWEQVFKPFCDKLIAIDDLGDRKHFCDFLVDQNYGSTENKYRSLVPENCTVLAGPRYALLRPEFLLWRRYSLQRRSDKKQLEKILITMGGVDLDNYTGQVLQQLAGIKWDNMVEIVVIMSMQSPNLSSVIKQAENMEVKTVVKTNVENMAEIMSHADLAIGATGATTWERCCLGLPTIQLIIAENQRYVARFLAKDEIVILIDDISNLKYEICSIKSKLDALTVRSSRLTDGNGAKLVLEKIGI